MERGCYVAFLTREKGGGKVQVAAISFFSSVCGCFFCVAAEVLPTVYRPGLHSSN